MGRIRVGGGHRVTQQFAYHRAVAPMMWVFFGIASVELVVTHLLLAL